MKLNFQRFFPYRLSLKFLRQLVLFCLLLLSYDGWSQLDDIHYFPPIHSRQNGQIAEQYVYLSTPELTPFVVTLVDGAGNFIGSATISKDNPENIYLGSGQVPGTDAAVPRDSVMTSLKASGIIATGDYPFYCNVRIKSAYHATSVACKGRAALGKTFYTGSMPQVVSNSNRNFVTSIMATEDGTIVNVNNYDTDVQFETPGPPIGPDALTLLLNEGDCYVLSGYTTTTTANMDGFIGAKITSNNDIVVNTGNYMGSISSEGFQDGGMVQIVPVGYLGTEHVVVEGGGGAVLERPLVVGIADGTEIYINDIVAPVTTIDEGEHYLVPSSYYSGTLHSNMVIKTTEPVYVYQATAATTSSATSEFNFIPPLECYLTDFIDAIPDIDRIGGTIFDGILYVITTTGSTVTVNGDVLGGTDGPEPAVGLPDWETYNIEIDGDVAVESTGAMAAGFISVNGFAGAGAYYAGFTFDFQVDAGEDTGICIGEEILLYGTGAGDDGIYVWEDGIVDSVAFTPDETGTYYVTGTNIEGCEDEDSIIVTVYDLPHSDAGFAQDLCDTNATTLVGSLPLITGEGVWSMASGPSTPTFEDEADPLTDVSDLEEGTYELVWAVTNGTCEAVTDTVLINVYDMPESAAGTDQNLCNEYETLLNGNTPLGTATGLWTVGAGPSVPTLSDDANPASGINDLVEGTYELIWTVSNGTCPPSADTVLINVYDLPVSLAGDDQEFCAVYEVNLNGNPPLGTAAGEWSVLSGPGAPAFDDATDPVTMITGLEEGTYELIWTLSNGSCPEVEDTMIVTIYDPPISNAGPDQTLCDVNEVSLSGNTPAGSSNGVWSFFAGPTTPIFADELNPLTTVSGLEIGTYDFVWTVMNGICDPMSDTVTITINPFPVVAIQANTLTGCAPLDVAFINLSDPIGDDCLWEFGDGSFAYGCGDAFHTYNDGVFDVTLTVTSNGCTTSETFVNYITAIPFPVADFEPYPNVINITNTNVEFRNFSENGVDYRWDFGDGSAGFSEFEPSHTYPEVIDGVYEVMLIVENEFGCSDTAYGTVAFEDLLIFYVPNAFTPDGSGRNDDFKPIITSRVDPYDFNMKIFNRWGELLFETYDLTKGWNGTFNEVPVQDGVYVWTIDFGDTNSDRRYSYKGHINLLR